MKRRYVRIASRICVVTVIVLISWNQPPIAFRGLRTESQSENRSTVLSPRNVFEVELTDFLTEKVGELVGFQEFDDRGVIESVSRGTIADLVVYRNDFAHSLFSRGLMQRLDPKSVETIPEECRDFPFIRWLGYRTGGGPYYAIPYLVRRTGLLLRSTPELPSDVSWNELWNDEFHERVATADLLSLVLVTASIDGIPLDGIAENPDGTVEQVADRCRNLMRNGLQILDNEDAVFLALKSGDVDIGVVSEDRGRRFASQTSGFQFVLPREGAIGWIYSIGIPVRNRSEEQSYLLLSALADFEFASLLSERTGNIVLVAAKENELSGRVQDDTGFDIKDIDSLIILPSMNVQAQEVFDDFVQELKSIDPSVSG